jgi:tripartite-type tricarboxylate transporter receptor subunit TctC
MIGASIVAKGSPDGHALLLPSGAFTAHAASVKDLPYDPVRDFTWITTLLTYPFVVIVKGDSPPPNVPRPIVARLNREFHAVLQDPETLKHVQALGGEVRPSTPEELRQRVEGEIACWRRIVAERRIEVR